VMLYGTDVVDCEIDGVKASNRSKGHRFHANRDISLTDRKSYSQVLFNDGKIIAEFARRRQAVADQVAAKAKELGGEAVVGEDLLEEVTALVEWPVALAGKFDKDFLDVPAEALISSMKEHQKYFHVVDADGKLMPYFITVSNLESTNPAEVIDGNERVIRPRLADAARAPHPVRRMRDRSGPRRARTLAGAGPGALARYRGVRPAAGGAGVAGADRDGAALSG